MLKKIEEFIREKGSKDVLLGLVVAIAAGVAFMLFSGTMSRAGSQVAELSVPPSINSSQDPPPTATQPQELTTYERALERRLEEALSKVEGVGRVHVVVNFVQGRETVFVVDSNTTSSVIQEQDAQGGTRYQSNQTSQDKTIIITDRTGVDRPLVQKEIEPIIGGVIIIAEGGGDIIVRDALIRATSTLLGLDINSVHVMQMQRQNR